MRVSLLVFCWVKALGSETVIDKGVEGVIVRSGKAGHWAMRTGARAVAEQGRRTYHDSRKEAQRVYLSDSNQLAPPANLLDRNSLLANQDSLMEACDGEDNSDGSDKDDDEAKDYDAESVASASFGIQKVNVFGDGGSRTSRSSHGRGPGSLHVRPGGGRGKGP